jgi:hypothetical protein
MRFPGSGRDPRWRVGLGEAEAPGLSLVPTYTCCCTTFWLPARSTGSIAGALMQIKIRYLGGTPGARKELTNLVRLAGYAIQIDSSSGRRLRRGPSGDIGLVIHDDLLSGQRRSPRRKDGAAEQSPSVMTITGAPAGGRGKLPGSRTRATNLRGLREGAGKTQAEIARRTAMSQPQLSRLESRKDHLISTLRKYVRALGGEIDVVALIGGRRISLRDV